MNQGGINKDANRVRLSFFKDVIFVVGVNPGGDVTKSLDNESCLIFGISLQ